MIDLLKSLFHGRSTRKRLKIEDHHPEPPGRVLTALKVPAYAGPSLHGVLPGWVLNSSLEQFRRRMPELAVVAFRDKDGTPSLWISGRADEIKANMVWLKMTLEEVIEHMPDNPEDIEFEEDDA